ncbi:MAG: hypothetical protein WC889_00065 [Myxococcota bacterium]
MIADHQPGNRRLGMDTAAILVVELATGSGTRPCKSLIGRSIAGTKMEEKQNFRVRFLHTVSNNYLILFGYLPHPSWAQRPLYDFGFSAFFL